LTVRRGDGGDDSEPIAKGSDFNHKLTVWFMIGFTADIIGLCYIDINSN